jgi:hypothetical protein
MEEQRKAIRFQKQYSLTYIIKGRPEKVYHLASLVDISQGGLKFSSQEMHETGSILVFNIKFPFMHPIISAFEGEIIGVQKIDQVMIYKARVQFVNVAPEATEALKRMEEINKKK